MSIPTRFGELIAEFVTAGHPRRGVPLPEGHPIRRQEERLLLGPLGECMKDLPITEDRKEWMPAVLDYARHRKMLAVNRHLKRPTVTGNRVVDLEINSVRMALNYAIDMGYIQNTPLHRLGRFHPASRVRHSNQVMPGSADDVHAVAEWLLRQSRRTQPMGWVVLFLAYTGMRISEALMLRKDAFEKCPGFVNQFGESKLMIIRRAKRGMFNYIRVTNEFAELFEAHERWHRHMRLRTKVYADARYYFPSMGDPFKHIVKSGIGDAINRACQALGLRPFTPHGLRAFFVTVMRSRGLTNEAVAALIGDKTTTLISNVYGDLPEVWSGGESLTFNPVSALPAWTSAPEKTRLPDDAEESPRSPEPAPEQPTVP